MLTWSWIIQITIISLILIFLVHHLLIFFTSVLTVPKTKDLVNTSKQKYKDMYDVILSGSSSGSTSGTNINNHNNSTSIYNLEDILPPNEDNIHNKINMKTELKNFIKSQMNNNGQFENDNITTLENIPNQNNYSFIN